MPWRPLPRIAFAICTYPYVPSAPADLPLQIGDELYIIEQGGKDGSWYRGYLVAPPSLLAGLTTSPGQPLEARVFSGVFPRDCVEIRELLGGNTQGHATPGAGHDTFVDKAGQPISTSLTSSPAELNSGHAVDESMLDNAGMPRHPTSSVTRSPGVTRPPAPVPMLKIGDESVLGKNEPLVDEIASCLREWHSTNLHELLLTREYKTLDHLSEYIHRLDNTRRQLLHGLLTQQETDKLREAAVWDLVRGNKLLQRDVIVRSPRKKGKILTSDDSAIELSQLQAVMSLLDDAPDHHLDLKPSFHLLVELKGVSLGVTKPTTYMLSLYVKAPGQKVRLLSETFAAEAFDKHQDGQAVYDSRARCLFTDLTSHDIGDALGSGTTVYLAIRAVVTDAPASSTASARLHISSVNDSLGPLPFSNGTWRGAAFRNPRRSLMFAPKTRTENGSMSSRSETASSQSEVYTESNTELEKLVDSPNNNQRPVRRVTAIGLVDVGPSVKAMKESDLLCYLRAPVLSSVSPELESESAFDETIADIFQDARGASYKFASATSLRVKLQPFSHQDSQTLISETPTLLQSVQQVQRTSFPGAPTRQRSDIYLTLNEPYLPRGVLLAHPTAGAVQIDPEVGMANLQLTLEVRSSSGERIENCIHPASNSTGHTAWRTPAIGRGESWNQTIRLAIRPEQVPGSHIVMSLADAFDFPFALAWVPLWTDDAFIADGYHSLAMYKYDEITSSMMSGQGAYLQLPWSAKAKDESVTGPAAALHIETELCSTKYSSNPTLLSLLKWREHRSKDIVKLLQQFGFVPAVEIVKLLDETLDALFEVLVEYSGNDEIEDLVFVGLVNVLSIVQDRRFDLQPLVDAYAATKFRQPFAFSCMVRSFTHLLTDSKSSTSARTLRSASKVGGHLFQFIVRARQQQITKEVDIGLTGQAPSLVKDLMPIFRALNSLMQDQSPVLVGTKTLIVQNYHSWLPPISKAVLPEELLALANNFVESCSGVQGRLVLFKLLLLQNLTSLELFNTRSTRATWQTKMRNWLAPHWGKPNAPNHQWRDQIRLCCSVVASMTSISDVDMSEWLSKLLQSYQYLRATPATNRDGVSLLFQSSFPFIAKSTQRADKYDEGLLEVAALLAVCSQSIPSTFPDLPAYELLPILQDCLDVYRSVLRCDAFPESWLSVHIYHHRACLRLMEQMFGILESKFLPGPDLADGFSTDLWRSYLLILMSLVGSDALALESFSEQKRRAVWKVGGDIREAGAELLLKTWETLGWETSPEEKQRFGLAKTSGYQVQYVPSLVGPVLQLCLSVHESQRGSAVTILHSMIISEGTLNDNLDAIKAEMIDALEQYFKSRPLNDGMAQKLFVDELAERTRILGMKRSDPLYPHVRDLLSTLDQLLDLLVALHSSGSTSEASQIVETLHLLEFFKDMQKEQMYVSYLHKLSNIQARNGNPTEAALALKLHADMYDWTATTNLEASMDPVLPAQTAVERKEQIYFQMISYLEEGAAWHRALAAYNELLDHYQYRTYDFGKLARTQRAMANIHERIGKGETKTPRYFKVLFLGLGFPPNVRDRQFVYEGPSTDRVASFTDRLLAQHPSAQIVHNSEVGDLEGQYLMVTAVSPNRNLQHPIARRTKIAQSVKNHFMFAEPTQFTITSRRQATKGEVSDQLMEKTIYTTAEPLPTVLQRSEVVSVSTIRIPPVQIGIERAMRKTQDLLNLEQDALSGADVGLNNMTETLKMFVSADSTGNIVGYWELLPKPMTSRNYKAIEQTKTGEGSSNSSQINFEVLRASLIDHAATIRQCLNLYSRAAHQATGADLRQRMYCDEQCQTQNADDFSDFERNFALILSTMDPMPLPEIMLPRRESPSTTSQTTANPSTGRASPVKSHEPSTLSKSNGTVEHVDKSKLVAPTPFHDRSVSKMSAFSREFDDTNDAVPPAIGSNRRDVTPKAAASAQSLQDRIGSVTGSVTKRLSTFNVGRRGLAGRFKGPTVERVAEQ